MRRARSVTGVRRCDRGRARVTTPELLALLLELADLIRDRVRESPTVRLMMPRRLIEILNALEREANA